MGGADHQQVPRSTTYAHLPRDVALVLQGSSEGGEQASRGKIVVLKKKVEELEQQLAQRQQELGHKVTWAKDKNI